jgi:hypothetical protein
MKTRLDIPSVAMLLTLAGCAAADSGPPHGGPPTARNAGDDAGYWTPERMREAEPFPLPKVDAGSRDSGTIIEEPGPVTSSPAAPPVSPKP